MMDHIALHLKDIYFKRKTGRLVFIEGSTQKDFFFQEGTLVFAKTNQTEERLGDILLMLGKISSRIHGKLHDFIKPGKGLGTVLLEQGLITEKDLREGLNYQMREIALNTFPRFGGKFLFHDHESPREQSFGAKLSIPDLIEDGLRVIQYDSKIRDFFAEDKLIHKSKEFINRLTKEEGELMDRITADLPCKRFQRDYEYKHDFFWKTVFLLYCLGFLEFREAKKIPVASAQPEPSPKPAAVPFAGQGPEPTPKPSAESAKRTSPEPAAELTQEDLLKQVLKLRETLPHLNYYELLKVDRKASQADIKNAYFSMAKRYHPDLFGQQLPPDVAEKVGEVFDQIVKAFHTLSSHVNRMKYDTKIDSLREAKEEDPDQKAQVMYRQARTLFNQKRYDEAVLLLKEAVRLKENSGKYFLLLAMAESRVSAALKEAEQHFLRAIELDSWNPDAHVGMGLLYKRAGLAVKAAKYFKNALEIDPDHAVALKELAIEKKPKKDKKIKNIVSYIVFGRKD